ncbi:MAG: STAS domain-containing protein [Chloroflexi bacterium]|nr:STAS domain-containing protein [Chloroflexota bacterium]
MNADQTGTTQTITASGRIDAASAPLLDRQLRALYAAGSRDIAIDMGTVTHMSSSGMRVLLVALHRQQSIGGSLVLYGVPERVYRVLAIVGFDRVLDVHPSLPAASDSVG